MHLTQTLEKNILKSYNKWLDSYLNGDVDTYDSYFDDAYHFIGSTNNEEFLTREDTTNFFKKTAEQFAGKTDLKNETKTLEQFNKLVFITHAFDAWFLNGEDWTYYGRFRFSSIMQNKEKDWKFIYQHFSTTDSKTDDGDTIGFDKVNLENQELREAIKRRTFELEAKNRELEIEGALERIRAQAVAMKQSSDLLDIVVTMRNEFTKLGHEAHYFWHMMWLPDKYEKAMTSGDGSKIGFVMKLPRHMHGDIPLLSKWEKSKKPTVVYAMNTKEAIDYVDKMVALGDFQNIDPQAPSHDDLKHIGGLTFIMARTTHGEIGYSLPGVVKNPPAEDLDILIQFAGAFDLAHRRFLDLQKAEKQAREVQIELALEKVRSRTMAMQHSDELQETSFLLDQQVRALGIKTWGCAFNIYGEKDSTEWFGNEKGVLPKYTVPRAGIFEEYYKKGKKGETLFVQEFDGKACVDHYEYMSTLPVIGDVLKNLKETNNGFPTYQIDHVVYFKYGYLLFITKVHVPDAYDIFKRFSKVFEQTYTRFLDLQKAEKQAREKEIELALEKVRSRTMAMHHTSELQEVIHTVHQELLTLGIGITGGSFISINNEIDKELHLWASGATAETSNKVTLPFYKKPFYTNLLNGIKNGPGFFTETFNDKEKKEFFTFLFKHQPWSELDDVSKNEVLSSSGGYTRSCCVSEHTSIIIVNHFGKIFSEDENIILKRFAKVFEQTYTRFLDLQKAEKQAKESQIELGLERVRARAMAMQHSDELSDLVATVLNELTKLDFALTWCIINIINEADQSNMVWATNPEGGTAPESYYMKFEDYPFHHAMMKAWKAQKSKFVYTLEGKEKKIYDDYLYNETEFKRFSNKVKKANRALDRYVASFTFSNFGGLQTVSSEPLSDDNLDILERFGKVFDLTYTRFNDLLKAEAQAKEAQIETALERVRSRSMAMHNSNEIGDVALVLFQQLKSLGGELWGTGFGFCKKDSDVDEYWFANEKGIMPQLKIPNTVDPAHKQMYQGWKKNLELLSIVKDGKALKDHYKYMLTVPDVQPIFQGMLDNGIAFPKWQKWHAAYFKYGYLLVITTEEYKNEAVFKRFAKVFEQAYTRFLDLQKAEAQAKEAQIEAALERVRSQSMGMQTSKDLSKVTTEMFNQLRQFGGDLYATGIVFCDKQKGHVEQWHSLPDAGMISPFIVPIDLDYIHQYRYDQWKKGTALFSIEIPSDFIAQHFNDIFKLPSAQVVLKEFEANNTPMPPTPDWEIDYGASFKHGYLLVSSLQPFTEAEILPRFAKVFEQTYTRFLDLKKAEAQAREALIEAALERVRSRSMAMHKSDELKDVVKEIFDQMAHLKINADHAGIVVDYEPKKDFHFWVADHQDIPARITVPYLDLPWDKQFTEAKKKGTDFFTTQLNFEEKNSFYKKLLPHIKGLTKKAKNYYLNCPGLAASTVIQKDIGLYIENFSGLPFSDAENSILMRFGKVFQQTYTRFLDLKKAEVQTRKAQIEVAVERIRAKSMAMHHPDDLENVNSEIYKQLQLLNINGLTGVSIWLVDDTNYVKIWDLSSPGNMGNPNSYSVAYDAKKYDILGEPIRILKKSKDDYFVLDYPLQKLQKAVKEWSFADKNIANDIKDAIATGKLTHQWNPCARHNSGLLSVDLVAPPNEDTKTIVTKIASAFNQAYTRFLDLQKAEAQTREAQIEAALERTRTQSMLMQHSNELSTTTQVFHEQLQLLGIDSEFSYLWLPDEDEKNHLFWATWSEHNKKKTIYKNKSVTFPLDKSEPSIEACYVAWESGETVHVNTVEPSNVEDYFNTWSELLDGVDKFKPEFFPEGLYYIDAYMDYGCFGIMIKRQLNDDEKNILSRFSKEFQRTYTRFLDLQKAEAQTKEAKIEAALEKVRSRTMAMQKGEEVKDVVVLLYKELIALGVTNFASCGYVEINEETQLQSTWVTSPGGDSLGLFYLPLTGDVHFDERYKAWKKQQTVFHQTVAGKERKKHLEYAITTFNSKEAEEMVLTQFPDPTVFYCFNFSHGYLHLVAGSHLKEEEEALLARFTRVFEQTYARFLDLEKAEAQTREAQINLAVERVRAKALAMHKSEEIMVVVAKLKAEVMALDIPNVIAATIFLNEGDDKVRMWDLSTLEKDNNGYQIPFDITFKLKKSDPNLYVKRVWENPENYFIEVQEGKDFKRIIAFLRENNQDKIADEVEEYTEITNLKRLHHAVKKLNNGKLVIDLLNPPSDEMETILTQMGGAFDLAYKRFEDLQKAEAQTREAQIEAALEKVRSRSLAMHKPEELQEVVALVAEKLKELGVIYDAGGVILCTYFPDNKDVVHWIAVDDFSSSGRYFVPYFDNPIFNDAWDSKIKGDAYFSKEFPVEAKNDFFKQAFEHSDYRHFPDDHKQHVLKADKHHLSAAWSKNSAILIPSLTGAVPSESDAEILKRFAKVFEQAYIRFMDLEKAEAQARESQIEAALERVRARALAMHNPEELKEVAHVLRTEMGLLGVDELETCSIYINDEETEKTECWYAIKDIRSKKQKLINDHFKLDLNDTWVGKEMLKFYRSKNNDVSIVMSGKNRKEWIDYCEKHSTPLQGYYGKEIPDRTYHLYKFSHGAIGVATAAKISDENWNLIKRTASTFSLAYSRFKDLTQARIDLAKLKEEKKRAEDALSELQLTQTQLIQSEKMASLGELTAGIAHEIQNPLNFVNNFSEVSKELLDEMLEEMENGDMEEVRAIMSDVVQNLEKINHHGKRADGIVKGMLQHSRTSSGEKEPTDINVLADEYLRLAYHGLRAKDKSFNATLETDFDETIGKINVIPQDMGRVILNLITNAFHAVKENSSEALAKGDDTYEPTVTVSTKKTKKAIEISVKDNGNGIPEAIKEKIFQPFFTTKPTGQGTGLGLSMSYDIVTKGHGGSLEVTSEEGVNSEFIITLIV